MKICPYLSGGDHVTHVASHAEELMQALASWIESRGESAGPVDAVLFERGPCLMARLHAALAVMVNVADGHDVTADWVRDNTYVVVADIMAPDMPESLRS